MAGFALEGVDYDTGTGLLNISAINEYRGQSYAIGGDEGAVTVANFVQHYNSNAKGASLGYHSAELCYGTLCIDFIRYPSKDVLNAAFSCALAMNLNTELDYLIQEMKSVDGVDYENDWKMITIQIGSNDQFASCVSPFKSEVTAEKWGSHVEAAIERIKTEIPHTVVNLLGVFEVSQVYTITEGQAYCHSLLNISQAIINRVECSCFLGSDQDCKNMDALVGSYNQKLEAIYNKYKGNQNSTFAVAYTPANINILGFSVNILSNVDCFHPNGKAHAWIAKTFWNQLFFPFSQKGGTLDYDANEEIYCPTEDDRIQI